ncbi:hypothetical protein BHE74_00057216 [Ensete ventricosum]|nr:hypothetical protein BHE74_00057216 [Ensete ventricosum]
MESVAEAKERVEILCWMLRDILQLSGEAIEDGKQLKEQLLTNFDELVATHLATEEVKRVWEEEKNQVSSSLAMLHTRSPKIQLSLEHPLVSHRGFDSGSPISEGG